MIEKIGGDQLLTLEEREDLLHQIQPLCTGPHVLLHTCNRVELYRGTGRAPREVALHLFRVTAGLESSLIGENHIQGQVKRAYMSAVREGYISPGLHHLFQAALRTGKRVRRETNLSRGAISHAHGALKVMEETGFLRPENRFLVVGTTDITRQILAHLFRRECFFLTLCNRTKEHALPLCGTYNASWVPLKNLATILPAQTVIVSATGAPHYLLTPEDFPRDRVHRLIIDLAVPRDIPPEIGTGHSYTLYNTEDVEEKISHSLGQRQKEIFPAMKIIDEEYAAFERSCFTRQLFYGGHYHEATNRKS
ncbi:glutamyl-tRNA reductase (GluTR) [Chitinivibrio alkaliphilus]|uniref:Glutamyl-tRNA reductase n=1 Tax=Chitinivibrio alkaliphilus ACht1 TaxID=1313304 RepID=U7DAE5_9BACT|nr:glutamyl-tRNA reductase (GluTR) [Chitinivibrio alkaliphilus]ERP39002.1 glutamyl-tRNA reductase (GluTR) [Chitinivibrio alkaliphilus ACht1]